MSHDLAEKLSGLASRTNNLAVDTTGDDSRRLLEYQDRLAKLALVAIVKNLNAEHDDYKAAIQGLNDAITFIGDATKSIEKIAKTIELIAKAADIAEKAIKTAAA